ncbi:hypothetical protein KC333_g6972 [Hortaea werneckii]|nr:hypothetical protein KC333_g6972 [Hortaea werneckii]KAI7309779.1 hypothetical protein KC326_g6913 [Hortaea werneckii]
MAAELSPLTDALPPEVRIRIYKEVLRADRPLLIARRECPEEVRFDTSLLFVCKSVFLEASDVFFEVNTIHLRRHSELNRAFKVDKRCRSDLRVLQNIRYLGLVDPKYFLRPGDAYGQWMKPKQLNTHIEKCLTLPKLKECTFVYLPGRLPWLEQQKASDSHNSRLGIKEYLEIAKIEHEHMLQYVDVGVVALQRPQGPTIKFVNRWLQNSWAHVKSRGQINVEKKYAHARAGGIYRSAREFCLRYADPAIWCALYDCIRAWKDEDSLRMRRLQSGFQDRLNTIPRSSTHAKLPQNLPLREVSRQTVDQDVIEWLSELLLQLRNY